MPKSMAHVISFQSLYILSLVAVVRVDVEKNELIFGCCETEASTSAFLRRFSQPLKCFFIEDIVLYKLKNSAQ